MRSAEDGTREILNDPASGAATFRIGGNPLRERKFRTPAERAAHDPVARRKDGLAFQDVAYRVPAFPGRELGRR